MKQLAYFLSSNKGLKGTAQYADKASEFWLQYRYGFLPLYLTVQDVIKQFNRDVKVWTRTAKRSSNSILALYFLRRSLSSDLKESQMDTFSSLLIS